ncbi:asparagine synthase-related protein [Amycolatopsis sp. CA-230715]|uniref:asparagine synthase-related protein n=1 Tax=Amycolatopsis sp. CA-230715 TaxID=2745196 RepID=UPI001C01165F|nr:asparagine synthase-related protein [Amycolatopsis sp. CA-230715]
MPRKQLTIHAEGQRRLALLGTTTATCHDLGRVCDRSRDIADLARVSNRFAGAYHVVGSFDGRVYAQGSASGMHRVYHVVMDGIRVIGDRMDVLAELGSLPVDDTAVAMRLVRGLPHPLSDVPLWSGVSAVAAHDCLMVETDGRGWATRTWWRRPPPELSRAEGAAELRSALAEAVRARTADGLVTCDLSGGLDSTPVCYFAARSPSGVIVKTSYNNDPGGRQDLLWARRALPVMPGVRDHVVESTDTMPDFYGGLLEVIDRVDEPTQSLFCAPRIGHQLRYDASHGVRTHLNGLGGDQVLCGSASWDHALFARKPLPAWRRARALHVTDGHSPWATLRALCDRSDYRAWSARIIRNAAAAAPGGTRAMLCGWALAPRFPSWLSAAAKDMLSEAMLRTMRDADPIGADRAEHHELSEIRDAARMVRGSAQLGARFGVSHEAPLLDDRVVEACLAVRREERVTPVEWKPLMKAAMRGLLPDAFLRRVTKTGGGEQLMRGFRAHRRDVLTLCESSGLDESGWIDMAEFTAAATPTELELPDTSLNEAVNLALFIRGSLDVSRNIQWNSR